MKLWFNIKDIIHLHIPDHPGEESPLSQNYKELLRSGTKSGDHIALHNILFDNSMRIWISMLSFVMCLLLWLGNAIPSFGIVVILWASYSFTQCGLTSLLRKTKNIRTINMALCMVDLLGISFVIYLTGASQSPMYFLYFMPLIIQAFHRDWPLLLLYGFGGMTLYGAVVVTSAQTLSSPELVGLGARLFMMVLTVNIAFLAVNLLRRKEWHEQKQLSRIKFLTYVSQSLNSVGTSADLSQFLKEFIILLNAELEESIASWNRLFLLDTQSPYLRAISDDQNSKPELKQMLAAHTCPAFQNSRIFSVETSNETTGCPTESFDFGSHICVPITGHDNESYGVLFSGSSKPKAYQPEEKAFFQFLAKAIGLAIQRLKRLEELQQSYEMDSFAMACFMESFRNPMATYNTILEGFSHLLKVDQLNLMVWDPIWACLRSECTIGLKHQKGKTRTFQMGDGIPGRTLESGQPYWAYDVNDPHGHEYFEGQYKEIICFPLLSTKGQPLGVLVGSSTEKSILFTVQEIDRASTFATRAAVAIENARTHTENRATSLPAEESEKTA